MLVPAIHEVYYCSPLLLSASAYYQPQTDYRFQMHCEWVRSPHWSRGSRFDTPRSRPFVRVRFPFNFILLHERGQTVLAPICKDKRD
ncbi:MAG: hypothetical protein EZS28_004732 [Streblomastix strix]|uniref:Uncharacterized protein n=1 Tax=Streblomastix strix TaxID=222440 RepID=A0A5J4WY54_9EUKA|nr:MAG: hypothetical protein EZS28_004732 [Streblomastix strix]